MLSALQVEYLPDEVAVVQSQLEGDTVTVLVAASAPTKPVAAAKNTWDLMLLEINHDQRLIVESWKIVTNDTKDRTFEVGDNECRLERKLCVRRK